MSLIVKSYTILLNILEIIIHKNYYLKNDSLHIVIMKQYIISMILVLLFSVYAYEDTIRVWQKVEGYGINHKLYQFLNEHGISNCYEYKEHEYLLRLRCYSDTELFDVDTYIYKRK